METKNNLLAKDLRFYSWFLNFREALIAISPITAKKVKKYPELPDSGDFTLLLENKGIFLLKDKRERGGVKDVGFQHFRFLDNVNHFYFFNMKLGNKGFVVKDGVLALEITEPYIAEVSTISKNGEIGTEQENRLRIIQYPGEEFLEHSLRYSLTTGYALPSLINDLYKYSLENNQSTVLEELLLKAGLRLLEAINESFIYAKEFEIASSKMIDQEHRCFFKALTDVSGFFIIDYKILKISLLKDKEEDLTPFSRELLKVVTKIPFHLKEYLEFFKLSLKDKDYSSEFEYFFKLLSKYEDSLDKVKVSNEVWKLLMYNSPLPLKNFNQAQEKISEKERKLDYAFKKSFK